MHSTERRQPPTPSPSQNGLNHAQQQAVETLEHFGWQLRFVRRPLFRDAVPVLFDRDDARYVVVQADGSLDESQTLALRAARESNILNWRRA
jgi:hypothetical protein